ncbi:MAG: hypothetical protein AAF191_09965 [Verrucomicrobiota bacterium]
MKGCRLFILWGTMLVATSMAEESEGQQVQRNTVALIQAFLDFPDHLIGGVAKKDRGEFLKLVSHYGDIDFSRGYFKLGGDGARAYDTPESRPFAMKLYQRKQQLPLCVVVQASWTQVAGAMISFISFGPFWRWTDETEQILPKETDGKHPWCFLLDPDTDDIMVGWREPFTRSDGRVSYRRGPIKGKLVWREERFSFEPL